MKSGRLGCSWPASLMRSLKRTRNQRRINTTGKPRGKKKASVTQLLGEETDSHAKETSAISHQNLACPGESSAWKAPVIVSNLQPAIFEPAPKPSTRIVAELLQGLAGNICM